MRTLLMGTLCLLLIACLGLAEDRRTDKSRVVIMTFNAEFLWDGVAPEEGQVNFSWKHAQDEAEDHMEEVAAVIIQSNPDIVTLIEVESLVTLTTFNEKFLAGRGYKPYLVKGKDTFTGQDVCLLTRIDPDDGQVHREDRAGTSGNTSKSMSKNLYARITAGDVKLGIVAVHFLSRPNADDRKHKRQAQADAARMRARALAAEGYHPIVLGDFNDYDGDVLDHIDSTPITNVLLHIRAMDPTDASDNLINVASLVPKTNRYTAHWDKNDNDVVTDNELTSIDHILVAQELASRIAHADIPHDHDPVEVTDHFPVVVHISTDTTGVQTGSVGIARLMPNPSGNERDNEYVVLKNTGNTDADLAGWKLRDRAQKTWSLTGTISAGAELKVMRAGQAMAMNNGGDTIDLIDPGGNVVETITYQSADEEEELEVG